METILPLDSGFQISLGVVAHLQSWHLGGRGGRTEVEAWWLSLSCRRDPLSEHTFAHINTCISVCVV